jgi:putative hemolysin
VSAGWWLIIGVAAIGLGSVFSAIFHSLREISRSRLEELAESRGSEAGVTRVASILEDLQGHSIAVALPRVTCNMVAVVFWITQLRGTESPKWIDMALGIAVASVAVWTFGLVLPSSIARHAPEATVYTWSPLIRAAFFISMPFQAVVRFFDELVRRLSGPPEDPKQAAQDDVLSVVEDAAEEGQFDRFERDMIESVMRFKDKTVQQIMTPRTEIEAIELTNNLGEITAYVRKSRHSRIPVYDGTIDRVVGVFYIKDLMKWLAGERARTGGTFDFRKIIRHAVFVPETKTIRELLSELIDRKVHLAVVADEYGGTAGIVTIEDIIEQIIGDIRDEYEPADDTMSPDVSINAAGNSAEVDARLYIHEANAQLRGLDVELPESPDYDTVGGYVTVTLGRIPSAGETMVLDGLVVTVLEAEPTRVERVRFERVPEPEAGSADAPSTDAPDRDLSKESPEAAVGRGAGK